MKTPDEFNDYFDAHSKNEFISCDYIERDSELAVMRLSQYYFFQEIVGTIGRGKGSLGYNCWIYRVMYRLSRYWVKLQRVLKVNRIDKINIPLYKGANWFSITDGLARYIISQKHIIKRYFRWTLCADEVFLQTLAMQSPYKENITGKNLREVDWKRGGPYTYTVDDFNLLITSENLFARKFSYIKDSKIVDMLYEHVANRRYTGGGD